MTRRLTIPFLALLILGNLFRPEPSHAQGMLLPTDVKLPPLNLAYQRVNITIKDQAAQTKIEQEFKNPSSQPLEATYIFPIPKGAGVQDFALWVDGKRQKGELVEANLARQIYTDIVRRTKDPGLLERMDDRLLRLRVFPVPAQGRQKIEVTYSEVVRREAGLVEYVYPLRTGANPATTEEDFTLRVDVESTAPLKNLYSPSHAVGITREGDKKAVVGFEQRPATLDRDFHLLWSTEEKAVGLAVIPSRENPAEDGYVLMLLSPSMELGSAQRVPRDIIFVVDSSGSMAGDKMTQAKGALQHCLNRLAPEDRFGIVRFATTTETFDRQLVPATEEQRKRAAEWVGKIEATGGAAIADAFETAFAQKNADSRNFTLVFLTDGQPTIGVTDPRSILQSLEAKSTGEVRVFTFGVGDDVNAALLDQVAEKTRGSSVYVRPSENIETKVSSFYDRISHPVLANLTFAVDGSAIQVREMYPPKLPDLFHGGQLVVMARYSGSGPTKIRFEGTLGTEKATFEFPVDFPAENKLHTFVPFLWAQRKIGYLLDQVRLSGENKELVDEIVTIAKKFGIVTPYTSYLVAPDERSPIAGAPPITTPGRPVPFYYVVPPKDRLHEDSAAAPAGGPDVARQTRQLSALANSKSREELGLAQGFVGVDNARVLEELKSSWYSQTGVLRSKNVAGRNFQNVRGVWMDETTDEKAKTVRVKYLSPAYFQVVNAHAEARKILSQGDRVVWRTPTNQTLVVDGEGEETLSEMQLRDLLGG